MGNEKSKPATSASPSTPASSDDIKHASASAKAGSDKHTSSHDAAPKKDKDKDKEKDKEKSKPRSDKKQKDKPKKEADPDKKKQEGGDHDIFQNPKQIDSTMRATLGGEELQKAIALPPNEKKEQWIAVNTIHFYNAALTVYSFSKEFCTPESCPIMNAGKNYEYLWSDPTNPKYKKPARLNAPEYLDLMFTWVNNIINDQKVFPLEPNVPFPKDFLEKVKQIYKRLFRLYAHIYYNHWEKFRKTGANAHFNTNFKHFILFSMHYELIEEREMMPLKKVINKFFSEERHKRQELKKKEKEAQ